MDYISLIIFIAIGYLIYKTFKDHEDRLYRLEYKVLCTVTPTEEPPADEEETVEEETEVINGE